MLKLDRFHRQSIRLRRIRQRQTVVQEFMCRLLLMPVVSGSQSIDLRTDMTEESGVLLIEKTLLRLGLVTTPGRAWKWILEM